MSSSNKRDISHVVKEEDNLEQRRSPEDDSDGDNVIQMLDDRSSRLISVSVSESESTSASASASAVISDSSSMPPPPRVLNNASASTSAVVSDSSSMPPPPPKDTKRRKVSIVKTEEFNSGSSRIGFTLDYKPRNSSSQIRIRDPPPRPLRTPKSSCSEREIRNGYHRRGLGSPRSSPSHSYHRNAVGSPRSRSSSSHSYHGRTSAITLLDTNHGRLRRQERNIPRRDIQEAIKYGKREHHPTNPNLYIYKHKGQKHVVDVEESRRLVTTMVQTIDLQEKFVSPEDRSTHDRYYNIIHNNKSQKDEDPWKSHSILIVDKSGSMRKSDVNGCRTRLGAVWLSIAKDFIEHRLDIGAASHMDVISIILMGENASLAVDRHPTNAILYNKIVRYFWDSEKADIAFSRGKKPIRGIIAPGGHGCYGPSLKMAEEMMDLYDDGNAASALQVLLLSDGRPSDGYVFFNRTNKPRRDRKELTSKKRDELENAHSSASKILNESIERMASKYGRRFNFAAIGMGHMKDYDCLKTLVSSAKDYGSQANLQVPGLSCAEIGAAITSAATSLTACQTLLRGEMNGNGGGKKRIRPCLRESLKELPLLTEMVDESFETYVGEDVERYEYMFKENADDDTKMFVPVGLQHREAKGVAMKKCAFGEGQERLAFQFFEVAEDGCTVVGEPMVAKESRFIEDEHDELGRSMIWKNRDQFAKRFCKIQTKAKICAEAFNAKLNSIATLDPKTARVSFIHCSVYYLTKSCGNEFAVIVEPKLNGRFEKWNNNNGWKRKSVGGNIRRTPLLPVAEGKDGNSDETDEVIDLTGEEDTLSVTKNQVAQAFSHFSYIHSGRKMVICDLQGIFCKSTNMFCLTDPAIHYHNARKDESNKKTRYGRTDMGQKGIDNFFKSHKCNALCHLVTGGFINAT